MSGALSFDPWDEGGQDTPNISSLSRISRGASANPKNEGSRTTATLPQLPPSPGISSFSGISSDAASYGEPAAILPAAPISSLSRISSGDPADLKTAPPAEHDAAPADPEAYQPTDPDQLRDGLRLAAMKRPPAWADNMAEPSRGATCSCCSGRQWWGDRLGWRCSTCHPRPRDYRASGRWREVQT